MTAAVQAYSGWLALAALTLSVLGLIGLTALRRRLWLVTPDTRRLVRDMEGKSVEQVVHDLLGNMELIGKRLGRLQVATDGVQRSLAGTVQHQGLVRYNADRSLGGELSFALALLDGEHNGVILASIHTLEECRLYVRSVEHGSCAHDLSEEEAAALEIALARRKPEPEGASRLRRTRWREKEQARRSPDQSARK